MHTVNAKSDLDTIKPSRLLEGMLAYVITEKKYYQLENNTWKLFDAGSGGGILQADTVADLDAIDKTGLNDGALCYVSDQKTHFVFNVAEQKWSAMKKSFTDEIVVGDTPPADESALWLDTSGDRLSEFYTP